MVAITNEHIPTFPMDDADFKKLLLPDKYIKKLSKDEYEEFSYRFIRANNKRFYECENIKDHCKECGRDPELLLRQRLDQPYVRKGEFVEGYTRILPMTDAVFKKFLLPDKYVKNFSKDEYEEFIYTFLRVTDKSFYEYHLRQDIKEHCRKCGGDPELIWRHVQELLPK
tara:strand:- start:53 stop:559 length:507 start_codon:yes stop_codon:yes gene_type:complete